MTPAKSVESASTRRRTARAHDACAARGRAHPHEAAIAGDRLTAREPLLLEGGHDARDRGRRHLLCGGELGRRPRPAEDEHREERGALGRQAHLDVGRAHAAEEMDRDAVQPVRHLDATITFMI